MGILINWSALIVVFCLGLVGIWTAYSFLNKKGLYLFSVLAVLLCSAMLTKAEVFSVPVEYGAVVMPLVYFALLTCYHKHGKDEAKKLFFITLISMSIMFVFKFFEAAYIDSASQTQLFLDWAYLGSYISNIIAFVVASALTMFIVGKINTKSLNNFLKLAIYLAIASAIDAVVFTLLVSIGVLSFGKILLAILIKVVLVCAVCLLLGYFEKFLNRKVDKKPEEKKQEPEPEKETEEKVSQEQKEDDAQKKDNKEEKALEEEIEISAPEDIS